VVHRDSEFNFFKTRQFLESAIVQLLEAPHLRIRLEITFCKASLSVQDFYRFYGLFGPCHGFPCFKGAKAHFWCRLTHKKSWWAAKRTLYLPELGHCTPCGGVREASGSIQRNMSAWKRFVWRELTNATGRKIEKLRTSQKVGLALPQEQNSIGFHYINRCSLDTWNLLALFVS